MPVSLDDVLNEQNKSKTKKKTAAAEFLSTDNGDKDFVTTIHVNKKTYAKFKAITKLMGTTCNSAINMMITNYILENKRFLDD